MSTFVREENIIIIDRIEPVLDLETGLYSAEEEEERIILGNIQPVTGEMLERLPDGVRSIDSKTIYVHEELQDQTVLKIKGNRYVVFAEIDWNSGSATIPHYVYLVKKEAVR